MQQNPFEGLELWFVTGSQHLYGEEAIRQVSANARAIVDGLNVAGTVPLRIVCKDVVTTPEAIRAVCLEANASASCAGIIAWMHTFSPAKMWIGGLRALQRPVLHLHTQFNRSLPWATIDMDFMNLNQAAHGDREFGFINARLRRPRKVVVGHWEDAGVQARVAVWARVAAAWAGWQGARIARIGDNMRSVAVTEGDKVGAEARFGFAVNGYGIGDLVTYYDAVADAAVDHLVGEYEACYTVAAELRRGGARHASLRDGARIELALRAFLAERHCVGFTTTFEDLHGLPQLPGLAVQRLMADGYGFAAEGDWKTAALLRALKVMAHGLRGGTSFMEDYTYHFGPGEPLVLGAHMLEICPSIAADRPSLEVHPLGIGGKDDPVRLVFDGASGPAINVSLIDLGNRFRLVLNEVDAVTPPEALPRLPVARSVWKPKPDFQTAAAAWIHAGGAHHTVFSQALGAEYLEDLADIAGVELRVIDGATDLRGFLQEMRWDDLAYHLAGGLTDAGR